MNMSKQISLQYGSNRYHFTLSNIKKLMGSVPAYYQSSDSAYFNLAFQDCPTSGCKCEDSTLRNSPKVSVFTRKKPCPFAIDCQSYSQWKFNFSTIQLNRLFSKVRLRVKTIKLYFLPIGPFPRFIYQFSSPQGVNLFQLLREYLRLFFTGCQVEMMPEKDIQSFNCSHRTHSFTQKEQYLVRDFFPTLMSMLPEDGFGIIGLSWFDLYPNETLNFVLGQASHEHFCCVASFGRFDPTTIMGFKGNENGIPLANIKDIESVDIALIYKLIKVTSHELCHVFGVSHCATFECLMNESNSSDEALGQPLTPCPICMKKIAYVCGRYPLNNGRFQVRRHLAAMLNYLEEVFCRDGDTPSNQIQFYACTKTLNLIHKNVAWIKSTLEIIS